jgi:uncharacterized membrane protein
MDELVFRFLIQSHITSFTKEDIYLQLLSHTDYPSLKAITDTLDYFDIESLAANVPKDALSQLPKSFLALVEKQGSTALVLATQSKKRVHVRTLENKKETLSLDDFSAQWTGTIIVIEEEKKASIVWNSSNLASMMMIGVLLLLVLTTIISGNEITYALYMLLTAVGVAISYLITKESMGLKDNISATVCNALSSKADSCNAVITSKAGEIGKGFGLGDASMVYFVSLFFITTFLGVQTSVLFAVSIGTLFIVGYSVYLQGIQLKQWCGLCLLISVVLISQFGIVFILFSGWDFSLSYTLKILSLSMIIAVLWWQVKPLIVKNKELLKTKKDYLSFKRNDTFFITALQNGTIKNLHNLPREAQVHFGDPNAPVQITAYTNPLCGYCVAAFEMYDRLLTQLPNDVSVQFVFNTPKDAENPSTQIAKQIIEIYHKTPENAFESIKKWFSYRDVKDWQEAYGYGNSMLLMDDRILQMHRDIAHQNDIQYTPETLIGNQKFPRAYYEYEDLLFFVDALKAQSSSEIQLREEEVL